MKAVLLGTLLLFPAAANAATGAALFNDKCSVCHTIGGGDGAGPDLIKTKSFDHVKLRAAVDRMQTNVGPMAPADIDALVGFLGGGTAVAAAKPRPRGIPANGRHLFFGDRPLSNGGSPCFACHAIEGRGGNLAIDLTNAKADIARVATQPPFPMMKAAYARHPVTDAEALDLAAFIGEPKLASRERTGVVHGTAAGIALLAFASVGLIVKRRRNKP